MRSGKAEGLLTWQPRIMNGLPSTSNWYPPLLVLAICAIGLFCATASGRAAASTNSPLRAIIGSRVAGSAGDLVAGVFRFGQFRFGQITGGNWGAPWTRRHYTLATRSSSRN